MSALNVLLFLGGLVFAAFTALFLVGAIIGLAKLGSESVRAMAGKRSVAAEAAAPQSSAAEAPVHHANPHGARPAEIYVDAYAAYARA